MLGTAIKSVVAQVFQDWELVVVDDGSTDNTQELVYAFGDERIRYIRQERNTGASAARNRGLAVSRGKYLAFLDSDDEWSPEKLARQMDVFRKSALRPGVVYTGVCRVDVLTGRVRVQRPRVRGDVYQLLLRRSPFAFSTIAAERGLVLGVGGFDESLPRGMDRDLLIRLARATAFDGLPDVLVRMYENHGGQLRGDLAATIAYKRRLVEKLATYPCVKPAVLADHHRSLCRLLIDQGDGHAALAEALKAATLSPFSPGSLAVVGRALLASLTSRHPEG